jgi:hypothetical protein
LQKVDRLQTQPVDCPTAVHSFTAHDTPDRRNELRILYCVGAGVNSITQVLPSHRSASAWRRPLLVCPTAVQAVADVHDTPDSTLLVAPGGFWVVWVDHLVPFQRSASVAPPEDPTAVQAVDAVQDTPDRTPPAARLGVGWIDHLVPFQRSASVAPPEAPTAVQAVDAVQDTPDRTPPAARVGVGRIDHPAASAGAGTTLVRHNPTATGTATPQRRAADNPTDARRAPRNNIQNHLGPS